jgi:VIT1/CCC1 family predicted Fe2+/Mn2+ transporter
MMIEELQLIADEENPFRNSLVTFFSFAIFGFFPIIPFIIGKARDLTVDTGIIIASILTGLFFLFVIGFGKSLVTAQKWYFSVG